MEVTAHRSFKSIFLLLAEGLRITMQNSHMIQSIHGDL